MYHRASIGSHWTVERLSVLPWFCTWIYTKQYTRVFANTQLKVMVIWSLLASKQSGWSLVFELKSYKVHSYVLLWFLNAKKKKCVDKWQQKVCWERGLFFLAESTLGLFWKVQGASWKTLPTNRWSNLLPIWLSPVLGSIQGFLGCECLCYPGFIKNQSLPGL